MLCNWNLIPHGGETHGPHGTIPHVEELVKPLSPLPAEDPRPGDGGRGLGGPGPVTPPGWGFNGAVPGIGSTGSCGTPGSMTTEWHHDLKMRVASGDPGPGGGLSQDADIPVAKWVGAYVPEAAGPYPAGDRPDGGPAGRPGLSSGLGVPASAGAEAVVRRSPGRRLFHPGQAVDLRQDKAVRVRVLGVWAPGQEEPWWLATDLPDPLADLVALYDRTPGYPGRPLRRSSAPPSTWPASPSSCRPPSGRPWPKPRPRSASPASRKAPASPCSGWASGLPSPAECPLHPAASPLASTPGLCMVTNSRGHLMKGISGQPRSPLTRDSDGL
jgi:hypothetical protein